MTELEIHARVPPLDLPRILRERSPPFATSWGARVPSGRNGAESRYLVVSPYTERGHLLDLETLNKENQILAVALSRLKNVREDYATGPYLEIFNWTEVIDTLRTLVRESGHSWKETSFYIVAFRSQIPPTTVYGDLGVLDKAAHVEATASGGFLKFVYPSSNREGPVLTTAGTGLVPLTSKGGISRRACGARKKMQRRGQLVRPIARPAVRRGPSIPSGRSTVIG